MELPEGIQIDNDTPESKVFKLSKALYGLKVSPKKWYERFSEEARKLGLENDIHEPYLFTWRKEGKLAVVVLYVDDMLIMSNDEKKLKDIKTSLSRAFDMKDLGEPKNFLGINIEKDFRDKTIEIHQAPYIENVLEKFNIKDCNPVRTPMVTRQVKNRYKRQKTEEIENVSESQERIKELDRIG